MNDITFTPFRQQEEFLLAKDRIRCLFAAKRSGKSEPAYIDTIFKADNQPNYTDNGIDPYMVAIIAPTSNMISSLVWPKFRAFAAPFEGNFLTSKSEFHWNSNNTIIHGVSAEKIERLEGKKLHHAHITEVFQMKREVFLEVLARVSDSKGTITIDGSLGPNIPNPKKHWVYEMFKKKHFKGARIWEWFTKDNPHFPKDELERMKEVLDPLTYRQMFEMDWDTIPENAVYSDFSVDNLIKGYVPDPYLETYISIDWGYAHPAAVLFFQYDFGTDSVYLFDEIVRSKMRIEELFDAIMTKIKSYRGKLGNIDDWVCDIAGDQEREQTGKSNCKYFKDRGQISFKKRRTAIQYGIPIARRYIKNGLSQRKFYVDEDRCPHSIDGIKLYHYPEKDGVILNENPIKKDDDAVDALRYFFVNILDSARSTNSFTQYKMR